MPQNPESKVAYRNIKRMQSEYAKKCSMDALVAKYGKTRNQNRSIDALGQIGIQAYGDVLFPLYEGGASIAFLLDGYVWLCKDIMGCYPSKVTLQILMRYSRSAKRSGRSSNGRK